MLTADSFDLDEANRVCRHITALLLDEDGDTLEITVENAIIQQDQIDNLVAAANSPAQGTPGAIPNLPDRYNGLNSVNMNTPQFVGGKVNKNRRFGGRD